MLRTNRRNNPMTPFTTVYMVTGCIVCWIACYIASIGYPVYGEITETPAWNWVCQHLPEKELTYSLGFLLMAGGAFLIHRTNYILILIREKTLLPILFYVLFISTNTDFLPLKSTSFGVLFLILAVYFLFNTYHNDRDKQNLFNAALSIAIGSLLWVHMLWFIPLLWYGMYKFRSFTPQTALATLLGVIVVYWIILNYSYWTDDYRPFVVLAESLFKIRPLGIIGNNWTDWIVISYMIILILLASAHILAHEYEDNLRTREYLSFLIILAIYSFALYFLYEQSSEEFLQIAYFPISILAAHFFTVVKNRATYWLFHVSVLLLVTLLLIRVWNF